MEDNVCPICSERYDSLSDYQRLCRLCNTAVCAACFNEDRGMCQDCLDKR